MQAIILMGPPGSGKGTAAEDLKVATHYAHVSTGDMLRAAVKAGSPVGLEAKAFMERGALVPDDVIVRLVQELLEAGAPDARYMFDGFPRTVRQAELLDELFVRLNGRITHVFDLQVPRSLIIERISARRVCRQCGQVYNLRGMRPKVENVCDRCGGEVYQRLDDNEKTVANRLDVYERESAPLIEYYGRRQTLVHVEAEDRRMTEHQILKHLGLAL
jgi:adenylate kinase